MFANIMKGIMLGLLGGFLLLLGFGLISQYGLSNTVILVIGFIVLIVGFAILIMARKVIQRA
jgi:hypothetical protein